MIACPLCDFENIEGEDSCQECGQSLSDLHLSMPPTEVERSLLRDRVAALHPHSPIAVEADTPVRDVLNLLVRERIGCVLVVEGPRLVGIFSERDALRKIHRNAAELGGKPIRDFMTSEPITLSHDAKLAFAVQHMDVGGYRHVPLTDSGKATVGVVSARDVLAYLTEKMKAAAHDGPG